MAHNHETNATREIAPEDMVGESLWLHVVGNESFETFPLPPSGAVIIGRSSGCDIQIDDPAVSRKHFRLHLGEAMQIEDLGSANGTDVRGRVLAPKQLVPLMPNDLVVLGSTITVTVKVRSANERPRRLWSHAYFEGRLEDELAQAQRFGKRFALLHVIVERHHSDQSVRNLLADALRASDIVGLYSPGAFEILLTDVAPANAQNAAQNLVDFLARNEVSARTGLACYPRDGTNPDALMSQARSNAQEIDDRTLRASPLVLADPRMQEIHELIGRVANGDISVLLLGETGTGKEVVAATVHRLSPRVESPFIRINCAALSESLLESELFGYEKGAFTGANKAKLGLLEAADKGTIFLDEVGEMPMSTQVKLLRVLEEREVLRVGGLHPRAIDVRFVSATNRNLEDEIEQGRFRQDLYYRLNGITIEIPPLRDRQPEIEPLARSFIRYFCQKANRFPEPVISEEARKLFHEYSWPGNIRQLRNMMERAVLLCTGAEITSAHLPVEKMNNSRRDSMPAKVRPATPTAAPAPAASVTPAAAPSAPPAATAVPATSAAPTNGYVDPDEAMRQKIIAALEACAGNQTRAAMTLGISRRTLINRLERYNIPRPRKRRAPTKTD